jgi:6-phosphogluconolactonase (cycloisomerase 2 family)
MLLDLIITTEKARMNTDKPNRRDILRSGAALGLAGLISPSGAAESPAAQSPAPGRTEASLYAYVGCYTTARRYARGDGIHVYRVDPDTGHWTHVQRVGDIVNPSFLALRGDQRYLYVVHGDQSYATAFAVDRGTGSLTFLNRVETGGRNGVHQAIDPSDKFMVVANYATGSVSVLPIREDGKLGDQIQIVPLPGLPGPNRVEQAGSHPHQIVFDPSGRFVAVPDKGLDRVFMFSFDPAMGRLAPTVQGSVASRSGSGPRRIAFHPTLPFAFVLNEISSTVVTYYLEAEHGSLQPVQILPTLPSSYTGENTASEIALSAGGRFVYCSNRTHDSVASFAIDQKTGLLTSVDWVSSRGRIPRYIGFDPSCRFLYGANEQSDTIVSWSADAATGRLTPTGEVISNASPVTIAFGGRRG